MKEEQQQRLETAGIQLAPATGMPNDDAGSVPYSLVYIPANDAEDFAQLFSSCRREGNDDEALSTQLEPYFALYDDETVDMALIQSQVAPAYEQGCSGGMCPHVSLDTLRRHAQTGKVTTINVAVPSSGGSTRTIRLYYDDSAQLKRRPLNNRIGAWLAQNSIPTEQSPAGDDYTIYGDVFAVRRASSSPMCESLTVQELQARLR